MLPCSKNSVPYPGKSFSFKLIKKSREIGLNCSLRNKNRHRQYFWQLRKVLRKKVNKNRKCHRQYLWQVRKVLRKLLHELSPRKSYRGGEKTWTFEQNEENFWLASILSLDPPLRLFCARKYFIFYIVWESGKPRKGEKSNFYQQHVKQSPYFRPASPL